MKKINIYLIAIAIAIAISAILVGCNTDEEVIGKTDNNGSKPFATIKAITGEINYLFSMNELQAELNHKLASKDEGDRYFIESVQLLDSMPTDENVYPEIKVVILDTENESASTVWLMGKFIYKVVSTQSINYYLDEDVEEEEYEFAYIENNRLFVTMISGNTFVTNELDSLSDEPFRPRWLISCTSTNCTDECYKIGNFWHADCTTCTNPGGECKRGQAGWVTPVISGIFSVIVAII